MSDKISNTILKSPVSGADLIPVTLADIVLHKDPESGGYWLCFDSLQALADLQQTPIEEIHTGETTKIREGCKCPKDGSPLVKFEFEDHSGVIVNLCQKCNGIWLDAGEITALLAYLEHYEFGSKIDHTHMEEHPGITQRVLLFLYQLTARPPLY